MLCSITGVGLMLALALPAPLRRTTLATVGGVREMAALLQNWADAVFAQPPSSQTKVLYGGYRMDNAFSSQKECIQRLRRHMQVVTIPHEILSLPLLDTEKRKEHLSPWPLPALLLDPEKTCPSSVWVEAWCNIDVHEPSSSTARLPVRRKSFVVSLSGMRFMGVTAVLQDSFQRVALPLTTMSNFLPHTDQWLDAMRIPEGLTMDRRLEVDDEMLPR